MSGGDILIADEIMNAKREENDGTLSKLNEKICSIQIKEDEKKESPNSFLVRSFGTASPLLKQQQRKLMRSEALCSICE